MRYGEYRPLPQWVGGTQKWTGRSGTTPRAIVIHRMEGSLEGTDQYFRREYTDYYPYARMRASTHFGVGMWGTTPKIITWVDTIQSAWGWYASPNDIPSTLARQVFSDLLYPVPSYPYYASRIDLNRAVIAIEVEGFHYQEWPAAVTAKVRELLDAITRVHGPLTVMAHTDCSPKACPGMATFTRALPGAYGNKWGAKAIAPAPTGSKEGVPVAFVNEAPKTAVIRAGKPIRTGNTLAHPIIRYTTTRTRVRTYFRKNGDTVGSSSKWWAYPVANPDRTTGGNVLGWSPLIDLEGEPKL